MRAGRALAGTRAVLARAAARLAASYLALAPSLAIALARSRSLARALSEYPPCKILQGKMAPRGHRHAAHARSRRARGGRRLRMREDRELRRYGWRRGEDGGAPVSRTFLRLERTVCATGQGGGCLQYGLSWGKTVGTIGENNVREWSEGSGRTLVSGGLRGDEGSGKNEGSIFRGGAK
jgi:hypothetical protein